MITDHRRADEDGGKSTCGHFLLITVLVFGTAFFAGCAGKNFETIRPGIESRGHYIEGVPFYKQSESTCGPAALASVFAFWGRPVNLEEITARVYLPQLRGTLPMDMESYARERGLNTASSAGTLADLKAYIMKGSVAS